MIQKIPNSEHANIIHLYSNELKSTVEISEKYKVHNSTIGFILKKYNIIRRNGKQHLIYSKEIIELYQKSIGISEIARKFNINKKSVNKILCDRNVKLIKDRNIEAEEILKFKKDLIDIIYLKENNNIKKIVGKKYQFDENYFENIDTRNKAYITGLLHSDGYLSKPNQIRIKLTDYDLIQEVSNRFYENKRPLLTYKKYQPQHKESFLFIVSNTKIQTDCIKHGCVHNKTYFLDFPTSISDEFIPDYLRGFFDGDGCIYILESKSYRPATVKIVATRKWAEKACIYLKSKGINSSLFDDKRHDNRITGLTISNVPDLIKFYYFIYNNLDNQIFLKRKNDKYTNWLTFKINETKEYKILKNE